MSSEPPWTIQQEPINQLINHQPINIEKTETETLNKHVTSSPVSAAPVFVAQESWGQETERHKGRQDQYKETAIRKAWTLWCHSNTAFRDEGEFQDKSKGLTLRQPCQIQLSVKPELLETSVLPHAATVFFPPSSFISILSYFLTTQGRIQPQLPHTEAPSLPVCSLAPICMISHLLLKSESSYSLQK